jgi:diguanylate cyclase (GGDEF)-like protein
MTLFKRCLRWFGFGAPPAVPEIRRADTDELTELANRRVMHDTLAAALQSGAKGVVVMLDLDNFKYFNDRHGHRVGDELLRVVAARLRATLAMASCLARASGDQFVAFLPGLTLGEAMRKAQDCVAAMREEARTDALTGLRNRLALDELLHTVAGDGDRPLHAAAIAFIDVDHFGNYNHVHGDSAGDDALKAVARAIKACAREADFVFRKGGEEFVVVLPEADSAAAGAAAERIRGAVQDLALAHAASSTASVVTVTIGVASGPAGATPRQLLSAAAEQAMAGKVNDQRNQVHAVRLRDVGSSS